MKEKLILLFAAIGLSVIAQNLSQNSHAYISDEEANEFIESCEDIYEYSVRNDTLFISSTDEFYKWPLGDCHTLEELTAKFQNPVVVPYYSERYQTTDNFYQISTPNSETIVAFGPQFDLPEIHSFITNAKISGDVSFDRGISIGLPMKELLKKLDIPYPHNMEKLKAIFVTYRVSSSKIIFNIKDSRICKVDIF